MAYKVPSAKQPKSDKPFAVKKKFDPSRVPIYYLEDPEGNGLTEDETIQLWQYGVDTGIVWRLQGFYGRTAQGLLDEGIIHYPVKHKQVAQGLDSSTDFYGNPIPTDAEAKKHGLYKGDK